MNARYFENQDFEEFYGGRSLEQVSKALSVKTTMPLKFRDTESLKLTNTLPALKDFQSVKFVRNKIRLQSSYQTGLKIGSLHGCFRILTLVD